MHPESNLLPLSGLQHLLFCERQCALIHVERLWQENRWTAEGQVLHKKAHDGKPETRDGERITRGLPLRSYRLGLVGVADIVLWKPLTGIKLRGKTLRQAIINAAPEELAEWQVTPVEYKRGRPKKNDCDRVQLCAQAMCLEEMLGVEIVGGQLYYGAKRRRFDVELDDALRTTTAAAAERFHELMSTGVTPPAEYAKKCDTCSLFDLCLPTAPASAGASRYVTSLVAAARSDSE